MWCHFDIPGKCSYFSNRLTKILYRFNCISSQYILYEKNSVPPAWGNVLTFSIFILNWIVLPSYFLHINDSHVVKCVYYIIKVRYVYIKSGMNFQRICITGINIWTQKYCGCIIVWVCCPQCHCHPSVDSMVSLQLLLLTDPSKVQRSLHMTKDWYRLGSG